MHRSQTPTCNPGDGPPPALVDCPGLKDGAILNSWVLTDTKRRLRCGLSRSDPSFTVEHSSLDDSSPAARISPP
jgi:hypothetical protein